MRRFLIILAAATGAVMGTSAPAQDAAGDVAVTIGKRECEYLMRHRPAPDVAYRPGVDVRGRAVAPAEGDGPAPLKLPDTYTFAISRTIAGLPGGAEAEMAIGTIEYDINSGRMTFNGHPLTDPLADELVIHCRTVLGKDN